MRRFLPHLFAALILALFVMALFARLLFTDRVLASGDILLYFYPYRDYAAAALREGQLPLWNPYIFSGAPFLANPQAAVLYPLHWPLSWLPVTKQIYVSAALHAWILGLGGYVLLRRWRFGWTPALVTGLVLAGSGFYGGLIGHLNQMNAAAWLPWMVSLFAIDDLRFTIAAWGRRQDNRQSSVQAANPALTPQQDNRQPSIVNRQFFSRVALFSLLVALTLLAGHTQTAYINLFGVGVWIVVGAFSIDDLRFTIDDFRFTIVRWSARMRRTKSTGQATNEKLTSQPEIVNRQSSIVNLLSNLFVYALGVVLGVALSAAQLLPTLELSDLGLRSGGLTYWEATSFSLQPLNLLWTLLPSYGWVDLSVVFGVAFTEFVGYVGTIPLLLALVGLWRARGQRAWWFGVTFAFLGLFLALGRWNPFYYVLFQLVPGFDLFRTPARWLMLYTLGMAVLAGLTIDDLRLTIDDLRLTIVRWITRMRRTKSTGQAPNERLTSQPEIVNRQSKIVNSPWGKRMRLTHSTAQASNEKLTSQPEIVNRQSKIANFISLGLLTLISLDLILGARSLPHAHPTAPQAVYDVRTAPAHLLTDPARTLHPAAMGRFLSLSITTFDPGDMADWRRIYLESESPQLDEKAFMDLIIALKIQEILGPNLPLFWRVPAVDGFDGGVLPLQRYNQFMSLLIPEDRLVPDGRIREQLTDVPPADLLSLLNARYMITDKIRDLWFEGVYFDRQIGATLDASLPAVDVDAPGTFSATTVGVIGFVDGQPPAENQLIASLQVFSGDEMIEELPLLAGEHFADPALDSATTGAVVAFRDVENNRQEYLARLALTQPTAVDNLRFVLSGDVSVTIQAVTLIDDRTSTFLPLLPSDKGHFRLVHSGDVKIYEALDVRPRAYMADRVDVVSSTKDAVARLQTDLQPGIAVVEASADFALQAGGGDVEIIAYAPEQIVIRTRTEDDSFLVLSDAYYPGWQATIDGAPTPIYPTNVLFRGVAVPAGEHEIVFSYEPQTWRTGVLVSGIGLFLWIGLLVAALFAYRGRRNTEQEN